jgi:hypothetical protein
MSNKTSDSSNTIKVIRIESSNKKDSLKGLPFVPIHWRKLPDPSQDCNIRYIDLYNKHRHVCGVQSLRLFEEWFTDESIENISKVKRIAYKLKILEIPIKYSYVGNKQVFFHRYKAKHVATISLKEYLINKKATLERVASLLL